MKSLVAAVTAFTLTAPRCENRCLMSGTQGKVEAVYIAAKHGELPHEVDVAVAQAGRGIEGDRNFDDTDPDSCNITFIEVETFDDLKARHGFEITALESRR